MLLFPGCFQVVFRWLFPGCWKRHGFATLPKSSRTGSNAMSARDCLSTLPCWDKASKMIDAGYMPGKVAAFIREQNGDGQEYTLLTLKKYIQLYRRHFVSPAAGPQGDCRTTQRQCGGAQRERTKRRCPELRAEDQGREQEGCRAEKALQFNCRRFCTR